jgi:hypothetical protein
MIRHEQLINSFLKLIFNIFSSFFIANALDLTLPFDEGKY